MTKTVSLRLSIQDAETVRAALEKLGTDGQAALKKLDTAGQSPSNGLKALDTLIGGLKGKAEESAGSLGLAGTALTRLGPLGLAAGAGLGLALGAMYEMSKAAEELGAKSLRLTNFANSTGLTVIQIQALTSEGSKFGLTSEQVATEIERFTSNVEQLRKGTGPLYDQLRRISSGLTEQMAAARGPTQALDLLAQAYVKAGEEGDKFKQNALARAAFGQRGIAGGLLLGEIGEKGGVAAMATEFQNAGKALDEGLIKRLGVLKTQLDETKEHIRDIFASLFSEDILQRELKFAQTIERIVTALAQIKKNSPTAASVINSLPDIFDPRTAAALYSGGFGAVIARMTASRSLLAPTPKDELSSGLARDNRSDLSGVYYPANFGASARGRGAGGASGADPEGIVPSAEYQLRGLRELMSVLGAAATPTEQLKLKQLELAAALDKVDKGSKDYAALQAAAARGMEAYKFSLAQAAVAVREQLGLASEDEIAKVGLKKLDDDEAKGYVRNAEERAAAEALVRREAKKTAEATAVRASPFPGLTQFTFDAQNMAKTVDQTAVGALGNLNTALTDVEMGTVKGGDAFRTFGQAAIKSILEVVNKMLLLGPLASGIKSLFSGGLSFGGFSLPFAFAGGGIMTSRGPVPLRQYAGGGIADRPQAAIYGEGSNPEAYVPLPDGRSIPVSLSGSGGGGGAVHFAPTVNVPPNWSPQDASRLAAEMMRQARPTLEAIADGRLIKALRTGGTLNPI